VQIAGGNSSFDVIQTVISDLGNVLLHFDHMQSCRELAKSCPLSPEQIYDSMFESGLVREYELGRISSAEFARMSMERLNVHLEMDLIREIWSDIFYPVSGMEALMTSLKGTYRLVLLSNTNEWHFEHCHKKFPVVRLFEHLALSYRLGCQKPDREIFERALAMANARPEETLYVDDMPAYVESARRLGMKAVCFKDRDRLRDEMRSAGMACP